jgi:hypothetical protein
MILSAALLLAFAPPANPQWAPVGTLTFGGSTWSVDKGSIVRTGRHVSAWFRVDSPTHPRWRQTLLRDEVDCDSRRYRTLEAVLYRVGGGSDTAPMGEWRDAGPGTAADREVQALCEADGLR